MFHVTKDEALQWAHEVGIDPELTGLDLLIEFAQRAQDRGNQDLKELLRISRQSEKEAWRYKDELEQDIRSLQDEIEDLEVYSQQLEWELQCQQE